jgi:hypothetical protein
MNLPSAGASDAVVIAKNPAKGQCMVNGIPLAVTLTGDPLNNYPTPYLKYRADEVMRNIPALST